jgi:8-oxo-dGTP diphosphatase
LSDKFQSKISNTFGNRVRIRACGILFEANRILLLKHRGIGPNGYFWSPPGGEVRFGEHLEKAVVREFYEETGLLVEVEDFLFITQYINGPLHAIEHFYSLKKTGGKLSIGEDPEMGSDQMIEELSFVDLNGIKKLGMENVHALFSHLTSRQEIEAYRGILN